MLGTDYMLFYSLRHLYNINIANVTIKTLVQRYRKPYHCCRHKKSVIQENLLKLKKLFVYCFKISILCKIIRGNASKKYISFLILLLIFCME